MFGDTFHQVSPQYIFFPFKGAPETNTIQLCGGAIKPDIVVWHRAEKWAKIIEVSVPNDFGLNRAEREKMNKYQDLKHDLRDTWDLEEIEIIPVIVGATGLVKKNLQEHLRNIPGQPQLPEIQLSAIKGTVSIIKRALGHFTK